MQLLININRMWINGDIDLMTCFFSGDDRPMALIALLPRHKTNLIQTRRKQTIMFVCVST